MKGLKLIPMFLALILFSYAGMLFVEANREEVVINFASSQTKPTALGLVVLTSILVGMVISGVLCTVELLALYLHTKNLKRKIAALNAKLKGSSISTSNLAAVDQEFVSNETPLIPPH